MRTAAKRDANERTIIDALKRAGCTVQRLSGAGMPDLLIGRHGRTHLLEVKMPGGMMTDMQVVWHHWWRGSTVHVVTTPAEALSAVGARRTP
jgi:hypothetical protein